MRKLSSNPTRQPSWFERLMSFAERSDPTLYNTGMVFAIVICSALLSLGLWAVAIAWWDVDPAADWQVLSFTTAAIVAAFVATPSVIFGYLLVARVQVIRDDLRKALEQTTVANRAKTDFLANMSHEIRTPLNGVLGMAQILEQSDMTAQQRESLRIISESGTLLMAIIDDVLDLSKIESGQISLDPRPERLSAVIQSTVDLFRARAAENDTTLSFASDPDVPETVVYDSVRARQCVANLVSNAVKFTKQGAVSVQLSTVEEDDGWNVSIKVRDTGIGIEAETLKRLFQPFEQADASTSREYGGTGLGLALSRRFARLMGGDIRVDSVLGRGSCFELSFRAGDTALIDAPCVQTHDVTDRLEWLAGRRILVVDDSQINRKVVQGLLKPHGPICIEAENGIKALQLLDQQAVDMVLLDLHMPVMDGRSMLAELRARPAPLGALPVIALTADLLSGRREDFLQAGFQGFLVKPLRRADLEAELFRIGTEFWP